MGLKAEVRIEDEACGQVIILAQFLSSHSRWRDVPSFHFHRTTVETWTTKIKPITEQSDQVKQSFLPLQEELYPGQGKYGDKTYKNISLHKRQEWVLAKPPNRKWAHISANLCLISKKVARSAYSHALDKMIWPFHDNNALLHCLAPTLLLYLSSLSLSSSLLKIYRGTLSVQTDSTNNLLMNYYNISHIIIQVRTLTVLQFVYLLKKEKKKSVLNLSFGLTAIQFWLISGIKKINITTLIMEKESICMLGCSVLLQGYDQTHSLWNSIHRLVRIFTPGLFWAQGE